MGQGGKGGGSKAVSEIMLGASDAWCRILVSAAIIVVLEIQGRRDVSAFRAAAVAMLLRWQKWQGTTLKAWSHAWRQRRTRSTAALLTVFCALFLGALRWFRTRRPALALPAASATGRVLSPRVTTRPRRSKSSPAIMMAHFGDQRSHQQGQVTPEGHCPSAPVEEDEAGTFSDTAQFVFVAPIVLGTVVASALFRGVSGAVSSVMPAAVASDVGDQSPGAGGAGAPDVERPQDLTPAQHAHIASIEPGIARCESYVSSCSSSTDSEEPCLLMRLGMVDTQAVSVSFDGEDDTEKLPTPSTSASTPCASCATEDLGREEASFLSATSSAFSWVWPLTPWQDVEDNAAREDVEQDAPWQGIEKETASGTSEGYLWGAGAFIAWAACLSQDVAPGEDMTLQTEEKHTEAHEEESKVQQDVRQHSPRGHDPARVQGFWSLGLW